MIKQVIDLWRRPRKPTPTPSGASSIVDASESMSNSSKISLGKDSFGTDGLPARATEDYIALEIADIVNRIGILNAKIDELFRRPRMPYTQGHSAGDILILADDGNLEPDWGRAFPPGVFSDVWTSTNLAGFATGNIKNVNKHPQVFKTRQPYRYVTTSGAVISTTIKTMTSTPFTTTTITNEDAFGNVFEYDKYHFGTGGWVLTSEFTTTDWGDNGPPGTNNNVTDVFAPIITFETIEIIV
jgi:hypothetical protein